MKDVISCDKLRLGANIHMTRRFLNGETRQSKPLSSIRQSITYGRERRELKHLSSRRKRKKTIDSGSSGERTRKSPNQSACTLGFGLQTLLTILAEWSWEDQPKRVKAPYSKLEESERNPKYIETRETLMEVGGTTPQG